MTDYKIIDDLRQHHLESWDDEYWERKDKIKREQIGRSTDEGLIVRAAFAAGWMGDEWRADCDERVKFMKPSQLAKLAIAVNAAREAARAIDPNLLWRLAITSLGMSNRLEFLEKLGEYEAGALLAVKVGENGMLEILSDTTMQSTSTTPATPTNEAQDVPSNGQRQIPTSGKSLAK